MESVTNTKAWADGAREFRTGRFFEAHEEWERLWLTLKGKERTWLQAWILLAAVGVKLEKKAFDAARRLAFAAESKWAQIGEPVPGWLSEFLSSDEVESSGPAWLSRLPDALAELENRLHD